MASFAEWTEKEKKKKKQAKGLSFTEYSKQVLGRDDIESPLSEMEDDDIAPVKPVTTDNTQSVDTTVRDNEVEDLQKQITALQREYTNLARSGGANGKRKEISDELKRLRKQLNDKKIVTATKAEEDDGASWFQSGAFSDGYQFGDVSKSVFATLSDVRENVNTAVVDATENLIDTTAYLGVGLGSAFGIWDEKDREAVGDFIAKEILQPDKTGKWISKYLSGDIITPLLVGDDADNQSFLGEKADGFVQSGAHLVGSAALNLVGVPMAVTMGVNAFGSEIESAFQNDATYLEAGVSGAVTTAAELIFEKISGAIKFGDKGWTDGIKTTISRKLSKSLVRTLANAGVDMAGEGVEEVLTEAVSAGGKKLTYMSEKEFSEICSSEDLMDAFWGGAIMGGGANAVHGVNSRVSGVDAVTGLSVNEEAVVKKVYEAEVAKLESNGEKLSTADKNRIWDETVKQMSEGELSIDTIEEVLGGDSYKAYKDAVDSEDAKIKELEAQIKELEDAPNTVGNSKKYDSLTSQLEELKNASKRNDLQTQLSQSVFDMVKNDRLAESYYEVERRGQDFVADFSKFEGSKHMDAARRTLENAMKAGANNTRPVRNFIEMVARSSGDTGLSYDFKSGDQIKDDFIERQTKLISEMEKIPEAQRTAEQAEKLAKMKDLLSSVKSGETVVNGGITENGIVLNLDSAKPLNRVVGHEVTHIFDQSGQDFDKLRDVMFSYAKTKKIDIDSKLAELTAIYEGVENANPEAELVADLVGDLLFSDADFVNHLHANHRNIFQKIYDEIKHLYKMATAGSKEARELERVKKVFEDIYRGQKNTTVDGGVKYQASPSLKNPKYLDPKTVTKQDVAKAVEAVAAGELDGNSYVPIRISTPGIVQERLFTRDLPMAMPVRKITQAMEEDQGPVEGSNVRGHGFSAEDIIAIIEKMDSPDYLYSQPSNNRGVAVVSHETSNGKISVFVDFDCDINPAYLNGYDGGTYNVAISPFEIDGGIAGLFQYAEKNHWIKVFDKAKEGDPAKKFPATRPFAIEQSSLGEIVPSGEDVVKQDYSLTDAGGGQYSLSKEAQTAKERFGTTTEFEEAGFILPNGEMLRFTDDNHKGQREYDHRAIALAYGAEVDLAENHGFNSENGKYMEAFVESGGIRFDSGDPDLNMDVGLQLSSTVPLTKEQEQIIRNLVEWKRSREELFESQMTEENFLYDGPLSIRIDFGGDSNYAVGSASAKDLSAWGKKSLEYDGGNINADRIINDIRHYYETGEVKRQSEVAQFHYSLSDSEGNGAEIPLNRRLSGDALLDAEDLIAEIESVADVSHNGYVTVYHRTTKENAKRILESGKMSAKEDGIFFSTQKDGIYSTDYGTGVVELKVPVEMFVLDDIFDSEAHLRIPLENRNKILDVSAYLPNKNAESDIRRSLSNSEDLYAPIGKADFFGKDFGVSARDLKLETAPVQETAPVKETVAENATVEDVRSMFPDDLAPLADDPTRFDSLTDEDAPPEVEAPYSEDIAPVTADDPFYDRDIGEVGKRSVKAYMYENPEVKPFFQEEAQGMLSDLSDSMKGERTYIPVGLAGSYGLESYGHWTGTKRHTTDDIAELLDVYGYSYAEIEKGLKAIIEDNGAENNACSKRIEFMLNDRLMYGYKDVYGRPYPPNQEYINLLNEKQINEYSKEAFDALTDADAPPVDDIAPVVAQTAPVAENIAPVKESYEAIRPKPEKQPRLIRVDDGESAPDGKQRKWIRTSTESEAVDGLVTEDDIPDDVRYYQVKSNKKTLDAANARLERDGYAKSREYFEGRMAERKLSVDDIALGERLIQEAAKAGDAAAVRDLIIDVSIIGTELGQRVQALSLIQRLTPEGQLKALTRTVERGKAKGDKAFDGVEVTEEMTKKILDVRKNDGTFDQAELDQAVEEVKQDIADQMSVGAWDYINAWRYLSMLGNPKTHIRNIVSNVAMLGARSVKNTMARTMEDVFLRKAGKNKTGANDDIAPVHARTKTWRRSTDAVKNFAKQTMEEMAATISGESKYSDESSIKEKRQIFKTKAADWVSNANSDALEWEDAMFSKPAFRQTLAEYLTANGIKTEEDIKNNPELVAKAKEYALDEARNATFQQDSYFATKINEIEKQNPAYRIAIGSTLPFKKTPINIAKTGLAYSPLGFARNVYDAVQVKKGNMDASIAIDHLAQTLTGTSLAVIGYALAASGILNGAGGDDKEGKYDYQLGEQSYSLNFGGNTYSLSWLSPAAMPMLMGANAYEQLVEEKEWNSDVVVDTLAQTVDPLSEMSFLSSLDDVLSSYDSGIQKFAAAGGSMAQNYATQFVPTLSGQIATVMDDTKRSTKADADSGSKFIDETVNKFKYKIPGLRNTLEPSTDIWGNEVKLPDNVLTKAFETFLAPYARREDIATAVDEEIKELYRQTGDSGLIPSIPDSYTNYEGEKYKMSGEEYTAYKKQYGQTAFDLMEQLFDTSTYKNADAETKADMVNSVYDYARDEAKRVYLGKHGVTFTNSTEDNVKVYKENAIKGAIEHDMTPDEYTFYRDYPGKYRFFQKNGISYKDYESADEDGKRAYTWAYENPGKFTMSKAISNDFVEYYGYKSAIGKIKGVDNDGDGRSDSGTKKAKVIDYIESLNLDAGQKMILHRSLYDSKADRKEYDADIVDYLFSRTDLTDDERITIFKELGFEVKDGYIYW